MSQALTAPRYHMLSYIRESGRALERTLTATAQPLADVAAEARRRGATRIVLSGVGSSYTAASAAKLAFDELVTSPTHVLPTTELTYHPALLGPDALVVILSRSGERKRVVDGLRVAQESGAFTVAVTGSADSLMAQMANHSVVTAEGPEISFPKTKSVTAGIGVFMALALALADPGSPDAEIVRAGLRGAPAAIDRSVDAAEPEVERISSALTSCDRMIVAGTAGNAGAAMEIALTLQESALVTAQWSDTGNLFHGPLVALDERWLVGLLVTADDLELSLETLGLIRALGGRTLAIAPEALRLDPPPDHLLPVAEVAHRILWPLAYLPVLQLIAYHWTVARGLNPDDPAGSDVMLDAMLPPGRKEPESRLAAPATDAC